MAVGGERSRGGEERDVGLEEGCFGECEWRRGRRGYDEVVRGIWVIGVFEGGDLEEKDRRATSIKWYLGSTGVEGIIISWVGGAFLEKLNTIGMTVDREDDELGKGFCGDGEEVGQKIPGIDRVGVCASGGGEEGAK